MKQLNQIMFRKRHTIVCRFQEIVPLNAGNILGSENSKISSKWNTLIEEVLNKRMAIEGRLQNTDIGETPKVHPLKMHNSTNSIASDFQCLISKQMVGIYITIWVRTALHGYISYPSVSSVGCGLLGCLGNKVTAVLILVRKIYHSSGKGILEPHNDRKYQSGYSLTMEVLYLNIFTTVN